MVPYAPETPTELVVHVGASARRGHLAVHSFHQRGNVRIGHTLVAFDHDRALVLEIQAMGMNYLSHDDHCGALNTRREQTAMSF